MLDRADIRLQAVAGATPPVARLVLGRPVEEVAAIIPRIFNLCPMAQTLAIKAAAGWAITPTDKQALRAEICREHALRLAVILPSRLGAPRLVLPQDAAEQRWALFGQDRFPVDGFDGFLESGVGIAPLLLALRSRFAPFEASIPALPLPDDETAFQPLALENTVAARHLDHPLMRAIEAEYGRGPLWRVVAKALDYDAFSHGSEPEIATPEKGRAIVPAARGRYALAMQVQGGVVTAFQRVTPTDHLMADQGVMAQALASLPRVKHDEAPLLVDILDPCSPVTIKEADHA
ncbi:hydrogenase expression/formation protein HupK [Pseudoprimorskyibacter insulae]|uniref:Hydrogenase expression/formation protein HupK n=1 Tax=Pseudoprimorskyibacter insulae TaxID=1695997 RepID=A0A2R8AU32_9RHOB|nr:hydrogenase expression/formation protein HupK [Pseudoprimorskyibacter insulae]SPF79384.1 hypothetical protein PRI8871_01180 [Pseudoprimorskyibacter insulae]